MANFREMRNLVKLLDKMNDDRIDSFKKENNLAQINDEQEYKVSATKEKVITVYANSIDDEKKARKTYRDCTSPNYKYIRERNPGQKAIVTAAGGNLIKERIIWPYGLAIPTGYCTQLIEKNFKVITIILTFIAGIVIGALGL